MPFKNLEARRDWYQNNREKAKEYYDRWKSGEAGQRWIKKQQQANEARKKERDRIKAEKAKWQEENKELILRQRSKKDREYRKRRRNEAIEKMGGCCEVCGIDDPDVLQFDHIEPLLNTVNGHKKRSRSGSATEICNMDNPSEMFQMLCANCHVKKTRMNDEYGITWRSEVNA